MKKKVMPNYIQQIIELFGHNKYSTDTQKKVRDWLADEEHADEKSDALYGLWKQAAKEHSPKNMQESIQRMQTNIGKPLIYSNRSPRLLIWKVAAAVLLAVSSVSIYLLMQNMGPEDLVESYMPTAEMGRLTLPDGTEVLLNSQSTLLFPKVFKGKTRSVYLIGEANFKVKSDKKHPFIVKANDFQVTALGTEFNVKAYPNSNELIATLIEGRVNVEFNDLRSHVILHPNEQLIYDKYTKKNNLRKPEMEEVTAWQRGDLVFSNMKLEDILMVMERKFPYRFIYSLQSLTDKTYSFKFHNKTSLKEVMTIMAQVVGDIKYSIKGNTCYIESQDKNGW